LFLLQKEKKKRLFTNKCYSLSINRDKYKSVGGVSTIIRGEFEEVSDLAKQSAQVFPFRRVWLITTFQYLRIKCQVL
jgi:hypothetical protein